MQTRNDGTHVILPAAAPTMRRPDRARLPVTMLRQSVGKVRHDGSSAATMQPNHTVAERGRLHGASELDVQRWSRSAENRFVYYRSLEDERRWLQSIAKHKRLRWRDKRPRGAASIGCVVSSGYAAFLRGASFPCTSQYRRFPFFVRSLVRCVVPRLAVAGAGAGKGGRGQRLFLRWPLVVR